MPTTEASLRHRMTRRAKKLGWVIVGGESGPGPRPCKLEWIQSIVEDCAFAGVPVYVKQLGAVLARELGLSDRKGGGKAFGEWPAALRVRRMPRPRTESPEQGRLL